MKSRTKTLLNKPRIHHVSLERLLLYMAVMANYESYGNDFFTANEQKRARGGPASILLSAYPCAVVHAQRMRIVRGAIRGVVTAQAGGSAVQYPWRPLRRCRR
jgi:hypothetical protein